MDGGICRRCYNGACCKHKTRALLKRVAAGSARPNENLRSKAHLGRMVRFGFAFGTQQFGERLRVLQVAEDFGFAADYGEITGGQG